MRRSRNKAGKVTGIWFAGANVRPEKALSAEIEEPFGTEPNDLALDAMSAMIESTLREMMGEALPPRSGLAPGEFIES